MAFLPLLGLLQVQVIADNITIVAYINKQGGVRFHSLCLEEGSLWNWCIRNYVTIQAIYLSGVHNSLTDKLSRSFSADYK